MINVLEINCGLIPISLHVHLRFDLPFTNFHIDYDLEKVLTVVKSTVLNLYD